MKKHLLAIAAILLILSVTACTQYVFDWDSLRPQEITDIEDLVLFMQSRETASARLNLTVDPDDSYFPITINGTKKISGSLKIEESRFPIFSSTTTTPPGNNSKIASSDALFVIADGSSLEIKNLTATVSTNAVDKVEAIIYVNTGRLTVDSFTTPASVTGLAIGPNATASQISITDSNIGKIAIDETNKDTEIYDEIINGNTSDAEITTGFDVATVENFETIFAEYGYVRLTADLTNLTESIKITNQSGTIDLNGHTITYGTTDDDLHTGVLYIEGGNITITGNGIIEATDGYHVSCIKITENGSVTIENGTFTCTQGDAIDIGVKDGNGGNAIINGGSFEGQEFCVGIWGNSNVTINDGSFTARDNAVIGTNGADTSNPSLTINGGTFTGNIISFDNDANAPYIACGIYMACNVDVTITAADFIINGGVGILLRGGSLDMQGGRIINNHIDGREKGVVGDSHVMLISDEAIVVDQRASDYPAANSIEIINNGGYDVVELDEEGNPITK